MVAGPGSYCPALFINNAPARSPISIVDLAGSGDEPEVGRLPGEHRCALSSDGVRMLALFKVAVPTLPPDESPFVLVCHPTLTANLILASTCASLSPHFRNLEP